MVQGLVRTRAVTAEGPGSTLVGELRSHRLCSVAKKKKRKTQTRANKTHLWAGRGPQYSQTLSGGVGKGREGPVEPLE